MYAVIAGIALITPVVLTNDKQVYYYNITLADEIRYNWDTVISIYMPPYAQLKT